MDWLITPLSQEQLQELKSMKNESPSYYKKIVSSFEKNVRAYRDYDIYGIGMYFSKDRVVSKLTSKVRKLRLLIPSNGVLSAKARSSS